MVYCSNKSGKRNYNLFFLYIKNQTNNILIAHSPGKLRNGHVIKNVSIYIYKYSTSVVSKVDL